MLLVIEPKRIERVRGNDIYGTFCLDDCIATYTSWINRDYELMYADSWNFKCDPCNENINAPYDENKTRCDNLELYHGVKITWDNDPFTDGTLEFFMNELKKNRPLILALDCFYCPWDWGFQSYHSEGHSFLITGFQDSQNLYCVDPFFMKKDSLLPISYLKNGFKRFATFSLTDSKQECNLSDLLKISAIKFIKNDVAIRIKNLANYIICSLDVEKELVKYKESPNTFLWNVFESDFYGRIEFVIMLHYIARKLNFLENNLMAISNRFLNIIEQWQVAKGMLGKIFMLKESQEIRSRLAIKISEIADSEKEIALELMNIQTNKLKKENIAIPSGCPNFSWTGQQMEMLDLTKFYNNQGFGTATPDCNADLTGMGQYFLFEGLPKSEIWEIEEVKFKFSRVSEGDVLDNISCMGQKINLPLVCKHFVVILGCAEFGDFQEYINIRYSDGEIEKLLLRFTDWFANPRYGERVAWEGFVVNKNNNEVKLINRKYHIFMQKCSINSNNKTLSEIMLPECPNLHVFAITLIR